MASKVPTVAEALKAYQKQHGITQAQMATRVGLQPTHYSELLNGKRPLSIKTARKAYALGIPAEVLLGGGNG